MTKKWLQNGWPFKRGALYSLHGYGFFIDYSNLTIEFVKPRLIKPTA